MSSKKPKYFVTLKAIKELNPCRPKWLQALEIAREEKIRTGTRVGLMRAIKLRRESGNSSNIEWIFGGLNDAGWEAFRGVVGKFLEEEIEAISGTREYQDCATCLYHTSLIQQAKGIDSGDRNAIVCTINSLLDRENKHYIDRVMWNAIQVFLMGLSRKQALMPVFELILRIGADDDRNKRFWAKMEEVFAE